MELDQVEDPWTTHARLTMGCTFLNRKKGLLFVRKARKSVSAEVNENIERNEAGERSSTRKYFERLVPHRIRDLHRNSRLVDSLLSAFAGSSVATNEDDASIPDSRQVSSAPSAPYCLTLQEEPNTSSSDILLVVRDVINIGFTTAQVESALNTYSESKPDQRPTVEELVQLILKAEDER